MRTKKYLLLLCLFILLLPAGCGKKDDTQLVQPEGGRFQATAPASWQIATGRLNSSADLELTSPNETAFFMLISMEKSNQKAKFTDYVKAEDARIAQAYLPVNKEITDEKVGAYDAKRYSFDTDMKTVPVHMYIYLFETEHYFAKAYAWGMSGNLRQSADDVDVIISSIEEQAQEK